MPLLLSLRYRPRALSCAALLGVLLLAPARAEPTVEGPGPQAQPAPPATAALETARQRAQACRKAADFTEWLSAQRRTDEPLDRVLGTTQPGTTTLASLAQRLWEDPLLLRPGLEPKALVWVECMARDAATPAPDGREGATAAPPQAATTAARPAGPQTTIPGEPTWYPNDATPARQGKEHRLSTVPGR